MRSIIILYITTTLIYATNIGHRLGGNLYTPENTLYSYSKLLKNIDKVKFIEFDVQETKDHELVVFHDRNISRLVPNTADNSSLLGGNEFNKIKIRHLTSNKISKLVLDNNASIPTLQDILETTIKWNIKKPIHIDIKSLYSDIGRYKLIKTVANYSKKLDISFIIFSRNFKKSFPYKARWISLLQEYKIKMYQIDSYDLTQVCNRSLEGIKYKTILKENSFNIRSKRETKIVYPFSVPKNINTLLIGIYHGKDNSGDGGIHIKITDKKKKILLSNFSNQKYWEWFTFKKFQSKELVLIVEDNDTKFIGHYPGNRGKVKIIAIKGVNK